MFDQDRGSSPRAISFRYSNLDAVAQADAPSHIVAWEASPEFESECASREQTLLDELKQQAGDQPLFYASVLENGQGIPVANNREIPPRPCALFFSSRIRSEVYAALHLQGVIASPVEFTATEFVSILRELEKVGTAQFVLDRCPRCWNFQPTASAMIGSAEDAVAHLAKVRANESVRADFYLEEARKAALASDYQTSRDLALGAIAHIAPDDSRFHAHLAALGGKMRDANLAKEAQAALEFFKHKSRFSAFLRAVEGRISMFF